MKELSIEEKAKRYDEAIERAKESHNSAKSDKENGVTDKITEYIIQLTETIFPELKESEDEQIRKELLEHCINRRDGKQVCVDANDYRRWADWLEKQGQSKKTSIWKHWKNGIAGNGNDIPVFLIKNGLTYSLSSCLSFECDYIELSELDSLMLEKQGEQNPADKVEIKLKIEEGKWYVCISQFCNCIEGRVYKATSDSRIIDDFGTEYNMHSNAYKYFRLWTIQDAKDGDILRLGDVIAIFKKYIGREKCICYCSFCDEGGFGLEIPIENGEDNVYGCTNTTPATKEQRDQLEKAMANAGYKWNKEERKLKKYESKKKRNK